MRSEFEKTRAYDLHNSWQIYFNEELQAYYSTNSMLKSDVKAMNSAWRKFQHQVSKVDELTQLHAKELFNKKVVANKAAKQIVELQLKNDELQKRVDALLNNWSEALKEPYLAKDARESLSLCVDELEQALKGGSDANQ